MPAEGHTLAHARAPVDGRDEVEEGQHGPLPQAGVGLEGLVRPPVLFDITILFSFWIYLRSCAGHGPRADGMTSSKRYGHDVLQVEMQAQHSSEEGKRVGIDGVGATLLVAYGHLILNTNKQSD